MIMARDYMQSSKEFNINQAKKSEKISWKLEMIILTILFVKVKANRSLMSAASKPFPHQHHLFSKFASLMICTDI